MNLPSFVMARLVVGLTVLFIIVAQAQESIPCPYQSHITSDALTGHEGTSITDPYWFIHISDILNRDKPVKTIVFDIDNNHPSNYLPVEWIQTDGTTCLRFRDIEPGKCGYNDCPVVNLIGRDQNAYINYGPTRQFKKANAAIYIPQSQPPNAQQLASTPAFGPLLQSHIVADLQMEGGPSEHLDIEFGTEAEGRRFTYTFTNRGRLPVFFTIAKLSEALNQLGHLEYTARWVTEGRQFSAEPGETLKQGIQLEKERAVIETQALLEIESPKTGTSAAGQVTIYLPGEARQ
jgi:hypothetical protein